MEKKKMLLGVLACLLVASPLFAQNISESRFIEVTGSAEMLIVPDEVQVLINISEYWKEEFEDDTKYEDYETRVPIAQIEKNFLSALAKLGVTKEQITVKDFGHSWRHYGKDYLVGKDFEITFQSFEEVDKVISQLDVRGIEYIRLGQLKHKNILEYRKRTKINALNAAKEKAAYLLESQGYELGDILFIEEINAEEGVRSYYTAYMSNSLMSQSVESVGMDNDNFKKIKIRYEMKARYAIKLF